jgi:MFS family permease
MASYTIMLSQQLCGINIIAFYSSSIFSDAGFSTFGALIASCIFGFINFIGAFPAIWTMDTLGRRSLLLLTLPFMALTMFAAGLTFNIPAENPAHLTLLAILVYLFCAEYSPGMGPVPNTYSAEVFPLSHRELGMSLAVASANIWAAVLSLTFPRILAALKPQGAFWLYAALNIVAFVLVFLFVPETRLKSLDELDDVFSISSRTFVKYQTTKYVPWLARRYVLRQKQADLKPLLLVQEYSELDQDEDDIQAI